MSEISENVLKLILQKLESQEELLVLLIPDFKTKKVLQTFLECAKKHLITGKRAVNFKRA